MTQQAGHLSRLAGAGRHRDVSIRVIRRRDRLDQGQQFAAFIEEIEMCSVTAAHPVVVPAVIRFSSS